MTVTIPTSEAQYGYVVGRVIRALGDTTDADDKPDAVAAVGSVSFTPKATLGRTSDYSAFIVREKLTAPLDAQGNLVRHEGATPAGIALTVGAYRVEFALNSGSIPSFDIEVTAGHTQAAPLDLVTAAPYVPPSGVAVNTMLVPADAVVGQVLAWSASGLDWVDMAAAAGGVSSVAGRTGAVVLSSADLTDAASLATDAELTSGLAGKANTSHPHTSANITDWAEAVQDTVSAMLVSGANVTLTYDDASGKVTVTAAGGDAEVMRDTIGAALVGLGGVSVAVNDAADTITLSISGVTSTQISDATAVGRALLTAADAAAARTAIGAGTSSLALGTTGSTAAAGNHTHTPASIGAAAASHTHGAADLSGVVKTVNGTAPDGAGNVTVAAGGGSAPGRIVLRSGEYIGNGAWGSNSSNYDGLRAWATIIDVPPGTYDAALCTVAAPGAAGLTAAIHIYDGAETLIGSTPAFSLATTGTKITSFPAPLTLSGVVIAVIVMSQSDGTFRLLDTRPQDWSNTPVGTDIEYSPGGGLDYVMSAYSTAAPNLAATTRWVRNNSPVIRLRKA